MAWQAVRLSCRQFDFRVSYLTPSPTVQPVVGDQVLLARSTPETPDTPAVDCARLIALVGQEDPNWSF